MPRSTNLITIAHADLAYGDEQERPTPPEPAAHRRGQVRETEGGGGEGDQRIAWTVCCQTKAHNQSSCGQGKCLSYPSLLHREPCLQDSLN